MAQKGASFSRHILIDNYSTSHGLQRFDMHGFEKILQLKNAQPDSIILESTLEPACNDLIDLVTDRALAKSLCRYYDSRQIWPCSMCVAAWYLVRLGLLKKVKGIEPANKVVSFLPGRFTSAESEARDIIAATKFKSALENIETIFFESDFTGYSDWSQFDPDEYVKRNYLKGMLPEDKKIIIFSSQWLIRNCKPDELKSVADVGVGPNIYPSMMIAPFCDSSAELHLIDPVQKNRAYLKQELENLQDWQLFADTMNKLDPSIYPKSPKLPKSILIKDGDVFNLPENQFDLVMAFFVSESITDDISEVRRAMESLKGAVKPGGILITAHTLGAHGYFAGMLTSFPATPLTIEQVQGFYSDFNNVEFQQTSHNKNYDPRKSYRGMAVICGKKSR